jgi:hypothetical protein
MADLDELRRARVRRDGIIPSSYEIFKRKLM